jgi:hypothetical protein
MNHPTEGLIIVGTEALPPSASAEQIVKRFVSVRRALDHELNNPPPPPPKRYYG